MQKHDAKSIIQARIFGARNTSEFNHMRIVMVNWAPISEGALNGGGVNGYCRGIALELVRAGHEVIYLSSGRTYSRDLSARYPDESEDRPGPCEVRQLSDHEGIRVFDIVNSPVLSPASAQFREPFLEVSSPGLDSLVEQIMGELRPDVVHLHNIEGFSVGFVGAVRRATAGHPSAVLYSLHNYHTLCPQVNLMRAHTHPCMDFENGHLCGACVEAPDPRAERRLRAKLAESGGAAGGTSLRVLVDRWLERTRPSRATAVRPFFGTLPADYEDERYRPLTNQTPDPEPNSRPQNIYGRRRQAMVAMLNTCDRVFAVSDFVERLYRSMGVEDRVLRRLTIGTKMVDLGASVRRERRADSSDGSPITLGFLGYNLPFKGLPMLLDALELLTPEVLGCLRLIARGPGVPDLGDRGAALARVMAGVEFGGPYKYEDIPELLRAIDVGVVPSVWWDTGPQTVMEFLSCGAPVIGAALGGIPDFVRHGLNGLLFCGNDRFDLAKTIASVVRDSALLDTLRAGVTAPKTMAEHAAEMQSHYAECVAACRVPKAK